MPHWSCHYYRLETSSSFVVGSWESTPLHSVLSIVVYTTLILLNLSSIVSTRGRVVAAVVSGVGHLSIGALHLVRLVRPFRFEVFDHAWPLGASGREVGIVVGFGIACLAVAWLARR